MDPYIVILSLKPGGIKDHFRVFSLTQPGIESGLVGH